MSKVIPIDQLKVNPEYEALGVRMPDDEFYKFRMSIKKDRQGVPILINKDGIILDGHHRFRALKENGEKYAEVDWPLKEFANPIKEKIFVVKVNIERNHWTVAQRIDAALKLRPEFIKLAKLNESLGGKGSSIDETVRTNEEVAKLAKGTSATLVDRYIVVKTRGSEELNQHVLRSKNPKRISKAWQQVINEECRQKLFAKNEIGADSFAKLQTRHKFKLLEGDFQDRGNEIESNSVDLVIADSEYFLNTLQLHTLLAKLVERILRPGGSYIVFLVPQNMEPFLYQYILDGSNNNLHFWDRFILKMQGPFKPTFQTHVDHMTKTLAWFCKGDRPTNPLIEGRHNLFDIIESKTPRKDLSIFTQGEIEYKKFIDAFTSNNDTVVDPVMGVGTAGLVALKLERRFIGIEKNPDTYRIAKAKFVELASNSKTESESNREKGIRSVAWKEKQLHKMLRGKGKLKRLQ